MTVPAVQESRATRLLLRALNRIEWAGNKLPHPFWLFAALSALLAVLSLALSWWGVSATSPADGDTVAVRNLLSTAGVRSVIPGAPVR